MKIQIQPLRLSLMVAWGKTGTLSVMLVGKSKGSSRRCSHLPPRWVVLVSNLVANCLKGSVHLRIDSKPVATTVGSAYKQLKQTAFIYLSRKSLAVA